MTGLASVYHVFRLRDAREDTNQNQQLKLQLCAKYISQTPPAVNYSLGTVFPRCRRPRGTIFTPPKKKERGCLPRFLVRNRNCLLFSTFLCAFASLWPVPGLPAFSSLLWQTSRGGLAASLYPQGTTSTGSPARRFQRAGVSLVVPFTPAMLSSPLAPPPSPTSLPLCGATRHWVG